MNRELLLRFFENYTANYDLSDPNIYLKYVHTKKVAENCEIIAKSLDMSEEEVDVAWKIGMLHDIGRFEQLKRFHTFNDAISIDHAQFGADLLFKEKLIEQTGIPVKEWELIETAIRCHSLYRIPENLTEQEKVFCEIIRDADKVDIYRANYETGLHIVYGVTEEEVRESLVTEEVYKVFCERRAIPRLIKRTVADHLAGHLALSFELVFPVSRTLADEQGFVWKLMETEFSNPDTLKKMKEISRLIREWYTDK